MIRLKRKIFPNSENPTIGVSKKVSKTIKFLFVYWGGHDLRVKIYIYIYKIFTWKFQFTKIKRVNIGINYYGNVAYHLRWQAAFKFRTCKLNLTRACLSSPIQNGKKHGERKYIFDFNTNCQPNLPWVWEPNFYTSVQNTFENLFQFFVLVRVFAV